MLLVKKVGESSRVDSVLESVIQKGLRESSKLPKVQYFLFINRENMTNTSHLRQSKTPTRMIGSHLKTCRLCSRSPRRRSWRRRRRRRRGRGEGEAGARSRTRRHSRCPTSCHSTSPPLVARAPPRPRWLGFPRSQKEFHYPPQIRLVLLACRLVESSSLNL